MTHGEQKRLLGLLGLGQLGVPVVERGGEHADLARALGCDGDVALALGEPATRLGEPPHGAHDAAREHPGAEQTQDGDQGGEDEPDLDEAPERRPRREAAERLSGGIVRVVANVAAPNPPCDDASTSRRRGALPGSNRYAKRPQTKDRPRRQHAVRPRSTEVPPPRPGSMATGVGQDDGSRQRVALPQCEVPPAQRPVQ